MKYFGTDGIRGTYGDFEVSEPFYETLGEVCANVVREKLGGGLVVVGCDTRASSDSLKAALIKGLAKGGRAARIWACCRHPRSRTPF